MNRKHPQIDASQMELFGFSAPAESNGTATAILEAPLQIEETRALIETLVDEVDEDAPKTNIPDEAWRRRNLALNVDDPVNLTPLERLRTNLLAITRIKDHQSGNSLTNKQRQELTRYTGWGGIANKFLDPRDDKNKQTLATLEETLGKSGVNAVRAGVKNAHYTAYDVVEFGWNILTKLGFRGGQALEPCCGIGNMIGLASKEMPIAFTCCELDPTSAEIARAIYPDVQVNCIGFEHFHAEDYFDACFTNVPFGDYPPKLRFQDPYFSLKPLIHDYFLLKIIDALRPGGVAVTITGKGTMDKVSTGVRKLLAGKADLIASFRLPDCTFVDNADTQVTTDLIVWRKRRPTEKPSSETFTALATEPTSKLRINEYYVRHPENMFGTMMQGGLAAQQTKLSGTLRSELPEHFARALTQIKKIEKWPTPFTQGDRNEQLGTTAPAWLKPGEIYYDPASEQLYRGIGDARMVATPYQADDLVEILSLISLKSKLKALIRKQINDDESPIEEEQKDMVHALDKHIAKFRKNRVGLSPVDSAILRAHFSTDPDFHKLTALAPRDGERSDILTKRTIFNKGFNPSEPPSNATIDEVAFFVRMTHGHLNTKQIARIRREKEADVITALLKLKLAYRNPLKPKELVHHIEYLSDDDIYKKFAEAKAAAEKDSGFHENVAAIESVIPKPVTLEEIAISTKQRFFEVHLLFKAFLDDFLQGDFIVELLADGKVAIEGYSEESVAKGSTDCAYSKGFEAYANNEKVIVRGENSEREMTAEEKLRLSHRKQAMRNFEAKTSMDFTAWCKEKANHPINDSKLGTAVRDCIENSYNQTFNRSVLPDYSRCDVKVAGISDTFKGKPLKFLAHQTEFSARMLFEGRGGCGFVVGAGKTISAILANALWKQSGLSRKPLISVPKKVLHNWAREWNDLFPAHDLLVIDQFDKDNKEALLAQIALSHPDAILTTHEQLKNIPNDPVMEQRYLEEEIHFLREQLLQAKGSRTGKGRRSIKEIEDAVAKLEARINSMREFSKTTVTNFTELGIDSITIDEAHNHKRLPVQTGQSGVLGLPVGSSQRAFDLYLKCRQILDRNKNRGVMLLTGTPISNTMVEIYNMMRLVAPDAWWTRGIRNLDMWLSNFGHIQTIPQILVDGTFGMRTVLASYQNLRELQKIFRQFWDCRGANELQLPRPDPNNLTRILDPSPEQRAYFAILVERSEAIRKKEVEPEVDNFLKITTDGRKAALDMRLVNPNLYKDHNNWESSKLNDAAKEIARHYHASISENRIAGQLVFFDLYSTTALAEIEQAVTLADDEAAKNEDPDFVSSQKTKTVVTEKIEHLDLHRDLCAKLVTLGVKAEHIAILNGKTNASSANKQSISDKYNAGIIRVLIGTTASMGEGMNLQTHTVAIHHVDAPLKPSHMEQRDGRGLRQGNLYDTVDIIRYSTRGSFDQYIYQLLARKAGFIARFLSKLVIENEAADPNQAIALGYEQIMAATNENPKVREFFTFKVKHGETLASLSGLQQEEGATFRQISSAEWSINYRQTRIVEVSKTRDRRNAIIAEAQPGWTPEKGMPEKLPLVLTVGETTYQDSDAIEETLAGLLNQHSSAYVVPSKYWPKERVTINGLPLIVKEFTAVRERMATIQAVWFSHLEVPIEVPEARTPASQAMGQTRSMMRRLDDDIRLLEKEKKHSEGTKASAERRLASLRQNFQALNVTLVEIEDKMIPIGKEIGAIPKTAEDRETETAEAAVERERDSEKDAENAPATAAAA
jgi:N12 class adenine-specific DNA methylase